MPHLVEDLQAQADDAVAAMRAAAITARSVHARAELMRHMRTTAAKSKDRNRAEAIEAVVQEWMQAWYLERSEYRDLENQMMAFAGAFYDYVQEPGDRSDQAVRRACTALEEAFASHGTSLADQMAWRSMCAHRWWEVVSPAPADLPGRKPRPTIPAYRDDTPFWELGCAAQCL